jgi:peptide/nickel transport system substrate-binding protein
MRWLVGGLALVALTSCGRHQDSSADLRLALINDPIMNPVLAPDIGSVLINKVLFPGLLRPTDSGGVEPDLALDYRVSPDGLEYRFALRPNVTWHDGHPFTAADVVFTFRQVLDPESGSLLWSDFSVIDSVEAIDSLTVRFKVRTVFAPLLTLLAHNAGIIPAHAFPGRLRDQVEFNRRAPVGTGPFAVTEVVPGSYLVLGANRQFYRGPPALDRIIFKIVPDVTAQVAQLRARELDLVTLEPANLIGLDRDPDLAISQVAVPQHYFIGFNQGLPQFRSPAVRRALTLAVNRQAIIDGVLRGSADYPQGTIPVALRDYYADGLPRIPYDTAIALALLADNGWRRDPTGQLVNANKEPFRITLLVDRGNPSREQTAIAIQHDLRRIGIDLEIQTLEFASLVRDYVQPHRYQAYLIWWNTPLDPDQYSYYGSGQANNDLLYRNRTVDSLLIRGRAVLDPNARREAYLAYQAAEAEDPPVLVLYYPREIQVRRTALSRLPPLGIRDALRHSERFQLVRR